MTLTTEADRVLIDTNVLVYALDPADHTKQRVAIDLLDALAESGRGSISVQCLTECFNAITRKIAQPISRGRAAEHITHFAATFDVHDLTSEIVQHACHTAANPQMSLWDALIWAVAQNQGITKILAEDMPHRAVIEGVLYLNPFSQDYDAAPSPGPDPTS